MAHTNEIHKKWALWALFYDDKDFKVSQPGVLLIKYSNLEIVVYKGGKVTFTDTKNNEILYQSKDINMYAITWHKTSMYIDREFKFTYHTARRLESQKLGLRKKFKTIF